MQADGGPQGETESPSPSRSPRRRRRTLLPVLLACAALLLLIGGIGVQALRAERALTTAQETAQTVLEQGKSGDLTAATRTVDRLADAAATAHDATSGPLWWLAARAPWVGDDAAAVSVVSRVLDRTAAPARELVHAAVTAAGHPQSPGSAGIDLAAVTRMGPPVRQLAEAASSGARTLRHLPTAGLLSPVVDGVRAGARNLQQVADVAEPLAPLVSLAPPMLGVHGPRHYLLAIQNPAEPRPTGGIVGAFASLRVDDGTVTLVGRDINDRLDAPGRPLVDFGPDYRELYGNDVALVPNVNLSPHFPYAARQLTAIADANGLGPFDGVVAVDPAVLASLLSVVGPVTLPDGTVVSADNVEDLLLRQAYERFAGALAAREQFILTVFDAAFDRLNTAQADPAALLSQLARQATTGHLLVWSARAAEQAALAGTPLAGALPAPTENTIGVYVTDAAGSKLGYYLQVTAELRLRCDSGQPGGRLTLQLRNGAPAQVPAYAANHLPDAPTPTTVVDIISVVLPHGAGARNLQHDGQPQGFAVGQERGHLVVRTAVQIPAGATASVALDVTLPTRTAPELETQPFVRPAALQVSDCSA